MTLSVVTINVWKYLPSLLLKCTSGLVTTSHESADGLVPVL